MMFHFSCGLQDFRLYKVYDLAWIWNVWSTNLLISRFYRIGASFTFSWNFLTLNLGQHHPGTGTIVYFLLLLLDFFLCYKTPLPIILLILTETCMQEISMWRERVETDKKLTGSKERLSISPWSRNSPGPLWIQIGKFVQKSILIYRIVANSNTGY